MPAFIVPNLYYNLPSKCPFLKPSIYSIDILAFTGCACSGDYGIIIIYGIFVFSRTQGRIAGAATTRDRVALDTASIPVTR